jgi:hypothetical protein
MEYPAIVTILVLLQFYWFSYTVGAMRVRHGRGARDERPSRLRPGFSRAAEHA